MQSTIVTLSFGALLKQLRKQAGMTQRDLAAALNYSDSLISSLEKEQRLPDLTFVVEQLIPALGLQDDPKTAAWLIERAAAARGELPPASITLQRTAQLVLHEEQVEQMTALPAPPTTLLGRNQEVRQLTDRLLGHHGRLLTLVGPPGIGKTTLALVVAAQMQPHYRDGVFFVPLAAVSDATTMAFTILAAIGISDASPKPPQVRLVEILRRKHLLLVLDNFEQLLAPGLAGQAVGLVAHLLAECPSVAVLVTSRERLHLRAEQRYGVPPLSLAAAVALFVERATAVDPTFVLTDVNRPPLEAICQRLDGLPLAIELCAAQIELLTPVQLLTHLQTRLLNLLTAGAHDLPPRQRTLRTAIAHSYGLLTEEQRTLFHHLGVFVGEFDLTAVARLEHENLASEGWHEPDELSSSLLATLRALVSKSLVHVQTTPSSGVQRFSLLETLREFAVEQLQIHGEETAIRQRHYAAYLQLFRTADGYLRGPESATWLARLQPEQDNLRAALRWTFEAARYTDMAWLLLAVGFFWYLNGQRYEGANWIARLLPHRQRLAVNLRLTMLVDFIAAAGDLEEFPSRDSYMAEILKLMEVCPYLQLHATAWVFMAWCASTADQTAAALARSVQLVRTVNEAFVLGPEFGAHADREFVLAANLWNYANFLIHQGQVTEATPLVTESLQLFRQRGNQPFLGDCLGTLGLLALLRSDLAEAHPFLQEVVAIGTTHNLPNTLCEWQPLLGIVTLYRGDVSEANRLLAESLRLCREVKNLSYLAHVCTYLAEAALWTGELAQAAQWLAQSLAYQGASNHMTIDELQRLFIAARLATAQGEYQRAATLLGVADAAHRQIQHIYAGPMLPLVDAALATVRAALDADLFATAFAVGQQMPLAEVFVRLLLPIDRAGLHQG